MADSVMSMSIGEAKRYIGKRIAGFGVAEIDTDDDYGSVKIRYRARCGGISGDHVGGRITRIHSMERFATEAGRTFVSWAKEHRSGCAACKGVNLG